MGLTRLVPVSLLVIGLIAGACTAEVEDEGEAPEVEAEGGEVPKVDVDPADVDVDVNRDTLSVPDVDVSTTPKDTAR